MVIEIVSCYFWIKVRIRMLLMSMDGLQYIEGYVIIWVFFLPWYTKFWDIGLFQKLSVLHPRGCHFSSKSKPLVQYPSYAGYLENPSQFHWTLGLDERKKEKPHSNLLYRHSSSARLIRYDSNYKSCTNFDLHQAHKTCYLNSTGYLCISLIVAYKIYFEDVFYKNIWSHSFQAICGQEECVDALLMAKADTNTR